MGGAILPVYGAAAGAQGSPIVAILSFLATAIGNYVVNDTNFVGLGQYLPGFVAIASGTPANSSVQLSTDNGTTWKTIYNAGGGLIYADTMGIASGSPGYSTGSPAVSTTATWRIVIATGATDIFLFVLGAL